MFQWVDAGSLSARKVVDRLNELGIPPRKRGRLWAKSSVLRILRNEVYAGVWYYNKHQSCEPIRPPKNGGYRKSSKTGLRKRPRAEWIPVQLPESLHMIGREQWERVQRQLDRNLAFSPRNEKHRYLLKGLVHCGGCTAMYVGQPCHGRFYYRCANRCKRYPSITEAILNKTVWTAVEEVILNPKLVVDQVVRFGQSQAAEAGKLKAEAEALDKALNQIQSEESRLLGAYRTGVISVSQLGQELEKINARRLFLRARNDHLSERHLALPASDVTNAVTAYCDKLSKRLRSFSPEERQEFLRHLIRGIAYEGTLVRIHGTISIENRNGEGSSGSVPDRTSTESNITTTMSYPCGRNVAAGEGLEFSLDRSIIWERPIQPRAANGQFSRAA